MSAHVVPAQVVPAHEVVSDGGLTPIEFTFKGTALAMESSAPTTKRVRSGQSKQLPSER